MKVLKVRRKFLSLWFPHDQFVTPVKCTCSHGAPAHQGMDKISRMGRTQFHISLLPTLFWMLGARLVLDVCHFGNTEVQDNLNVAFFGCLFACFQGFSDLVVDLLYFPQIEFRLFFYVSC